MVTGGQMVTPLSGHGIRILVVLNLDAAMNTKFSTNATSSRGAKLPCASASGILLPWKTIELLWVHCWTIATTAVVDRWLHQVLWSGALAYC
eukprot:SAG31_NODE_2671_length_5270_cov_5.903114_2_plen_92_part_00